jgi:hypothetical protein
MSTRLVKCATWAACVVAIVAVVTNSPAVASDPYSGQHYLSRYSPYPADLSRLYGSGAIPVPPYFSLHPPVYYSRPVARTYGYSPWAYPPQTKTPDVAPRTPKVIQNKFVPPTKDGTTKAAKHRVAAAPVRILNPFVTDVAAMAKSSAGHAKIIYPVAMSAGR